MNMMQTPTNMKEPGRSKIIVTIDRKGLLDDQLTNWSTSWLTARPFFNLPHLRQNAKWPN